MQIKRMNWVRKEPLYKQMEAQRERRRIASDLLDRSAMIGAALANAHIRQTVGLAELTAKASLVRTQNALKAASQNLKGLDISA